MTSGNIIAVSSTSASRQPWRERLFRFASVVFFFLLPLQTRVFLREVPLYEYGTLSVFLVEVVGWAVIALWAIKIKNEKLKIKNVWLLSFPASAFLSIAWAPDKAVALQGAMRLLEGVLLYVVVAQTFRSDKGRSKDLRYILFAFLLGATIQAGLGIHQFLTQSSFSSTWLGLALHDPRALGTSVVEFGDQRWLRAYGGLPHPNVLGGYLAIATAVAIAMLQRLQRSQRWQRLGLMGVIPILLTGIFFSFSRAAWIATAMAMYWWMWKKKKQGALLGPIGYNRSWVTGVMIAWIAVLTVIHWPLVIARLTPASSARLETKSRVERVEGVREAWELIKQHPLVGVGIGNYTQTVAHELRPGQPLYTYQPVHSVPLIVWAELGTVGLLLLVGALYKIARQSKFYILHFTFLILLVFDHYLWTLPVGILLFWAILGLSTAKNNTPS